MDDLSSTLIANFHWDIFNFNIAIETSLKPCPHFTQKLSLAWFVIAAKSTLFKLGSLSLST